MTDHPDHPTATPTPTDVWSVAVGEVEPLDAAGTELALRPPTDPATAAVTLAFGLADALITALDRGLGRDAGAVRATGDVALGLAWRGFATVRGAAGAVAAASAPLARLAADPPLVPRSVAPSTLAAAAAQSWQAHRLPATLALRQTRDALVPLAVNEAVAPIDLTELVLERVDLELIVRRALAQLDLTEIVVDDVDLGRVVDIALDQVDLTELVLERVDLQRLATAVLDQLDLNSVVRERVDLIAIADEVIDGVDLPEIIRASTGSVASETVRTVRMQSIEADEAVQRLVDRFLLWRKGRDTDAPGQPESEQG